MMRVKNMENSSNRTLPDGIDSWIGYWERKKNITIINTYRCSCCREEFSREDLVGGHVFDNNKAIYITPLCNKCNNSHNTNWFQVEKTDVVEENTQGMNALKNLVNKWYSKFK